MAKMTPLQKVKADFGTKAALAEKLIPLLERPEGEDDASFAKRIRTASNKQLIRLWSAQQRLKAEFGTKAGLCDAIVTLKFGKANADYRNKLATYAVTRLLDLHDSLKKQAA